MGDMPPLGASTAGRSRLRTQSGSRLPQSGMGFSHHYFPQPQSLPQPDFIFGRMNRMRKRVSVTITMPTAVRVCQSMLEADEFAELENDQ